jgi:capsular polysaccharide biosynthesis protein
MRDYAEAARSFNTPRPLLRPCTATSKPSTPASNAVTGMWARTSLR